MIEKVNLERLMWSLIVFLNKKPLCMMVRSKRKTERSLEVHRNKKRRAMIHFVDQLIDSDWINDKGPELAQSNRRWSTSRICTSTVWYELQRDFNAAIRAREVILNSHQVKSDAQCVCVGGGTHYITSSYHCVKKRPLPQFPFHFSNADILFHNVFIGSPLFLSSTFFFLCFFLSFYPLHFYTLEHLQQ